MFLLVYGFIEELCHIYIPQMLSVKGVVVKQAVFISTQCDNMPNCESLPYYCLNKALPSEVI